MNIISVEEEVELETMYNNAFEVLCAQAGASLYLPPSVSRARYIATQELQDLGVAEDRSVLSLEKVQETPRVRIRATVEEVPDEGEGYPRNVSSVNYVIEELTQPPKEPANAKESYREPPLLVETIHLLPRRQFRSGHSALGVLVLSIRGHIGSLEEAEVDLRLDSGADISLISEEHYEAMPPKLKSKLRQGMKMNLWQLTDKNAKLKGYIRVPIIVRTAEGRNVTMQVEAYVVPSMTVPILLGEDFQLSYELAVQRSIDFGTTVTIGRRGLTVRAEGVRRTGDFGRLRQSAAGVAGFIKAKFHHRKKAKEQRLK